MNMDKYFMWVHYERLHNHNKAKHNKTVCIFLGIYGMGAKEAWNPTGFMASLSDTLNLIYLNKCAGGARVQQW